MDPVCPVCKKTLYWEPVWNWLACARPKAMKCEHCGAEILVKVKSETTYIVTEDKDASVAQ